LKILKQTLQCHEESGTVTSLQQQDFYVANDMCERCHVPYLSLSKESRVVCPKCSQPKTAHSGSNGVSAQNFADSETENAKSSDRAKSYRVFLEQFREGTRVPLPVLAEIRKQYKCTVHFNANDDFQISRIKQSVEFLDLREWLPYLHRITLQLMRRPMPSLMKHEIDFMVEVYEFVHLLHQHERTGESFPNSKRITEMIFIWLKKPSFARCFITARTSTKRQQYSIFDKMTQLLEECSQNNKQATTKKTEQQQQ
jgi:uncharacterized Zn finger protein (UPF0148 family)